MSDSNSDIEKVKAKYKQYCDSDPFPEIEPSLLNSADIYDYVEKTGLIFPFYKENLKPASYGIKLKGEYIYWESETNKIAGKFDNLKDLDQDGDLVFILKKNSIAYVQLEPEFRFPSYIAGRFNLKIKHIYQGILLGTGPLVDPGYEGYVFMPLHNLTNNDYKIKLSKPIIWMEFTKLSSNAIWKSDYSQSDGREGKYVPFDKVRLNAKATLSEYINDAHPNASIVSTISGFFQTTKKTITDFTGEINNRVTASEASIAEVTNAANRATTQFNRAIIVAIISVLVTVLFSIIQVAVIHYKTIDYLKDYDKRQSDEHSKFMSEQNASLELNRKIIVLEEKIKSQDEKIKEQNEKIKKLKKGG